MRPVLVTILGLDIQSYGVSKVLAAVLAGHLLGRAFGRAGRSPEDAHALVLWGTAAGFAGAKLYYVLEQLPTISLHDFTGSGFTWYGGFLAGTATVALRVRRDGLPLAFVADAAAAPLSLAYGVGRLGCLLAGDGTYGRPTTLPWGMAFPEGVVATTQNVHPTPLYEAGAALVIALILWALRPRWEGGRVFAAYLILSGLARFGVELLRINESVLLGLTQAQVWALLSVLLGTLLIATLPRARGGRDGGERPGRRLLLARARGE